METGKGGERLTLILASASPRRLDLLRQIGVEPDACLPSHIDETPRLREVPHQLAERLAREKGQAALKAARQTYSGQAFLILSADTVVAAGRRILPKAESFAEAEACLDLLSGRSHRVYTAVYAALSDGSSRARLVETRVTMKRLSAVERQAYLESGEWQGKAGGYAIQGRAGAFVSRLVGSYSSVVGLPLYETSNLLTGLGYGKGYVA
jgi:septum formation protein